MSQKLDPNISPEELAKYFDQQYFGGGKTGYVGCYTDFNDNYVYRDAIEAFIKSQNLQPRAGEQFSILDVGCGRGYLVKHLRDDGFNTCGVDVSEYAVLTRVTDTVFRGNAIELNKIGIQDEDYDLAITFDCFEHIPPAHALEALREIARVSKHVYFCPTTTESIDPSDVDITHVGIVPLAEWQKRIEGEGLSSKFTLVDRREIKKQFAWHPPQVGQTQIGVQVGSHVNMFYNTSQTLWWNIDQIVELSVFAAQYGFNYIARDARSTLPFQDNSVNYLFSAHFFEHLTYDEGKAFLKECYRILKPSGVIRMGIPDIRDIMTLYLKGQIGRLKILNPEYAKMPSDVALAMHLATSNHKAFYDNPSLVDVIKEAGFQTVRYSEPFVSRDYELAHGVWNQYFDCTSYVEGTK